MQPTKNIDKLKTDFEDYVKKFDEVRELAAKFQVSPDRIINIFFDVGLECLKRTESILKNEFTSVLKDVFKDFPEGNKHKVDLRKNRI